MYSLPEVPQAGPVPASAAPQAAHGLLRSATRRRHSSGQSSGSSSSSHRTSSSCCLHCGQAGGRAAGQLARARSMAGRRGGRGEGQGAAAAPSPLPAATDTPPSLRSLARAALQPSIQPASMCVPAGPAHVHLALSRIHNARHGAHGRLRHQRLARALRRLRLRLALRRLPHGQVGAPLGAGIKVQAGAAPAHIHAPPAVLQGRGGPRGMERAGGGGGGGGGPVVCKLWGADWK